MEELLKELKERGVKKVALKFFWSRARKESYVELLPRETGEDLPYALEREVRAKLEESLKDLYAERRGCEVEGALAVDLEKERVSLSAKGYWPSTEVLVYEFEFPVEVSLELPEELAGLTGVPPFIPFYPPGFGAGRESPSGKGSSPTPAPGRHSFRPVSRVSALTRGETSPHTSAEAGEGSPFSG